MPNIIIYSDGGSRGNPGPAAYGFVIKLKTNSKKLKTIVEDSKFIGEATNNQAEYNGVLAALKHLKLKVESENLKVNEIICYLDSQLIVEQMKGNYKIKNEGLKPLYWKIRELMMDLGGKVQFEHVPRDKNEQADKLVNEAIDSELKSKS